MAAASGSARVGGERRQLTVMFCDLVGSTSLSEQLDPEDIGELVLEYQEMGRSVVARFGGSVAQYLGDGLLTHFGYPVAHEDDAERAVGAGLAILESLASLRAQTNFDGVRVEARVGIHSGPVVVGAMGSADRSDTSMFGSTPNVAARLEALAAPGTVVVSDATRHLLRDRFDLDDLGTPTLKGIDRPIRVWSVRGVKDVPALRRRAPGSNVLVGRRPELATMLDCIARSRLGAAQTVVVIGEPGVGKSRLVQALFDELDDSSRWLEFRCSELAAASPLQPVVAGLRRLLEVAENEPASEQLAKLEQGLALLGPRADVALPYIADLLGIDSGTRQALALESPELRRRHLLDALAEWALALCEDAPLVIVAEDVHWSDPSTLELLQLLIGRAEQEPLACVFTSRTELPTDWRDVEANVVQLPRLSTVEGQILAQQLAGGLAIAPDLLDALVARGDGIPLFIEELVKSAGELEPGRDKSELPPTLQGLLAARLDRLGNARSIAQAAAVIGREFPVEMLAAVTGTSGVPLDDALYQLETEGILSSRASSDGPQFSFRHALIKDAAYAGMLRSQRREMHATVAGVMQERSAAQLDAPHELVAYHLAAAGQSLDAAQWYGKAGRASVERAAFDEALSHYRSGIDILDQLDVDPARDSQLLSLLILLANAVMGTAGPGGDDVLPIWNRAVEIADRIGDHDELTSALNGTAMYVADRGDLDATIELAVRILTIADQSESRIAALRGNCTLGMAYLYRGEGARALHHSEVGIGLEQEGDFFTITYGVGHDQGVFARMIASWTLWWLGRPDAALAVALDADARAQRLPSSLTQAMARHAVALAHHHRGETSLAIDAATENLILAEELGFPFWRGLALLVVGTERARLGDTDGLTDLDRAFTLLLGIGNRGGGSMGLAMLAEAQHQLGMHTHAFATADAGLHAAAATNQPFYDPELLRLKAVAVLADDPERGDEAVALLQQSIALARELGAASFVLRSTHALVPLLGHDPVAQRTSRALLSDALASMGDGAQTLDQVAARHLLNEMTAVL